MIHFFFRSSCHLCDHRASSASSVARHVRTVHLRERPHECPQPDCSFSAAAHQDLRVHVESVHLKKRDVVCPHCGYCAAQVKLVNAHIRRRHGGVGLVGKRAEEERKRKRAEEEEAGAGGGKMATGKAESHR